MFGCALRTLKTSPCMFVRQFHASKRTNQYKATVVGAAGGIGQSLSLLLKYNPLISKLTLYDIAPVTPGVAADIGHINTSGTAMGYAGGEDEDSAIMDKALKDADVVVIPAGVPRQPGMTRDDLFAINGAIVKGIAESCSRSCPNAKILLISNPVNSTVPIFAEVLKEAGTYDKNKLFGVTTLDVCRANTFVSENQGFAPENTNVKVIGGHAGKTIIPLLSLVENADFTDSDIQALSTRVAFGGDEVVQAKAGNGSATLSMAHAAAVFTNQILRATNGETGITECAYVESTLTEAKFFSSPIKLGPDGIKEILPMPKISEFEKAALDDMLPQLIEEITKGVEFVTKPTKPN